MNVLCPSCLFSLEDDLIFTKSPVGFGQIELTSLHQFAQIRLRQGWRINNWMNEWNDMLYANKGEIESGHKVIWKLVMSRAEHSNCGTRFLAWIWLQKRLLTVRCRWSVQEVQHISRKRKLVKVGLVAMWHVLYIPGLEARPEGWEFALANMIIFYAWQADGTDRW